MTQPFPLATEAVQDLDRTLPAEALNIAGRALDAGIFYQDAFRDFCAPLWADAFPMAPQCITAGADGRTYIQAVEGGLEARNAQLETLKAQLSALPRGAWAMVRRPFPDDATRFTWSVLLSMGNGEVVFPGVSGIQGEPKPEVFIPRAVGYEIYCSRKCEEERRARITSRTLIGERGWHEGDVLRNITLGANRYSSATIVAINDDVVVLELTRRGSSKRWSWKGHAQAVEHADYARIPRRPWIVVVTHGITAEHGAAA